MEATQMKILVLGGDGYCGWPTALYLSNRGYEVGIVDDFSRRHKDYELGTGSLTPIATLQERLRIWEQQTGYRIDMFIGTILDFAFLSTVLRDFAPQAVVHFAEQRSAPHSMIDRQHAVSTQMNK
jgi:UDP-sulfoquinovose synthase